MNRFLDPIRPTVRAVIRHAGCVLVQVKKKPGRPTYLTLPGGKLEPGETLRDCVARECLEEIGARVTVGPLLHVAEVHKPKADGLRHQIEMLFECQLPAGYMPQMGPHPDPSQVDTVWADLRQRADEFRPAFAQALNRADAPQYLGVFHG